MSISETIKKPAPRFHWKCKHTWRRSAKNTLWCLLGCSIRDFGTILYFQLNAINWPTLSIMILAIINGLITSIILVTIILSRQKTIKIAFQTALTMSFISMVAMEVAMNSVDWLILGEAKLVWWIVPLMLLAVP